GGGGFGLVTIGVGVGATATGAGVGAFAVGRLALLPRNASADTTLAIAKRFATIAAIVRGRRCTTDALARCPTVCLRVVGVFGVDHSVDGACCGRLLGRPPSAIETLSIVW